jgi:glycosyltransferase involved in cell wall biosynthesis
MEQEFINSFIPPLKKQERNNLKIRRKLIPVSGVSKKRPTLLIITTYPPRECGIATFCKDLADKMRVMFSQSFEVKICPILEESSSEDNGITNPYIFNTSVASSIVELAEKINTNKDIELVLIQHEFGLFHRCSAEFSSFLYALRKQILITFHTVLPNPNPDLLKSVKDIILGTDHVIVMTKSAKNILCKEYDANSEKITVIQHGTHLVSPKEDKNTLKRKYGFENRTILATFGFLGRGKSIETTLDALPDIIKKYKNVLFLVIGKTHPTILKSEGGDTYRKFLMDKVEELNLQNNVRFINEFVPLETLLEYLQLTDIYLFTSKDPNQAVSGTFAYAMSCGCAIISTPIPHAVECLQENQGLIFDFGNSTQLSEKINLLLGDADYRRALALNCLHSSMATSWENATLAHANLFEKLSDKFHVKFSKPRINFDHLFKMTTETGVIQFSKLNHPDVKSGYTLDDNSRALIVMCEAYRNHKNKKLLAQLLKYFRFIINCESNDGSYLNYLDENLKFTDQNHSVNLEDSNGRAIWALGHLVALKNCLTCGYEHLNFKAPEFIKDYLFHLHGIHSPRAIAFAIKGLSVSGLANSEPFVHDTVLKLASKLATMFKKESNENWQWFENYFTYGNSVLSEAMLMAYEVTHKTEFKEIAHASFKFLLSHLFENTNFRVFSNETWYKQGDKLSEHTLGGQQPIDVAYTILALKTFHKHFPNQGYDEKMEIAFSWFLGNNHLNQMVYNPVTGGCHDGIELNNINLNQGAESVISYLMARLAMEDEIN